MKSSCKVGIGMYTLREEDENEKLDASQIIFESVCGPEDIKNTGPLEEDENSYSGNTKMLKAKKITIWMLYLTVPSSAYLQYRTQIYIQACCQIISQRILQLSECLLKKDCQHIVALKTSLGI